MKKNIFRIMLFIVCILYGFIKSVYAIDFLPPPIFSIEKSEDKTLIVEEVYNYTVLNYKQPLKLNIIDRSQSNYDSPENALITLLSGLSHLNNGWVLSSWDNESRKKIKDIFAADPGKEKIMLESWKKTYPTAEFFLLRRVDRQFKKMVILEYMIKKANNDELKLNYSFRNENGKWKATNMYSDDMILNHLAENKERIRIPGD